MSYLAPLFHLADGRDQVALGGAEALEGSFEPRAVLRRAGGEDGGEALLRALGEGGRLSYGDGLTLQAGGHTKRASEILRS